jgi:nicotinate-nucleotide pyrophosphorylase (carboxylating)
MPSLEWDNFDEVAGRIVAWALAEDASDSDVTTAALGRAAERNNVCHAMAREDLIVAGWPLVAMTYRLLTDTVTVRQTAPDGSRVGAGERIGAVLGKSGFLLRGERVALNLLCRLSGIATLTRMFVSAVEGTGVDILDTRKTTPCHRILERYAVRMGGGVNHRFNLASSALIKDNHIAAAGGIENLSDIIESLGAGASVEVEVDSLEQLDVVLPLRPDRIMLDNMSVESMVEAVGMNSKSECYLEASGGVTLETVRSIAETGVNGISIGSLTHSAPSRDIGFDWLLNSRERYDQAVD